MAKAFQIKNLNFKYPNSKKRSLNNINLDIYEEEFVLICGVSGSGKTTLLKCLNPYLTPKGNLSGDIKFFNKSINDINNKSITKQIAYLSQYADEQIVCLNPIHELAFGLENLGISPSIIKLRIAEIINFFGIEKLIKKNISSMSGGEKQLLNLASVMIMQPKVLLLDEPTSQLDPIATSSFISNIKKINSELGTTIVLVEHKTDGLLEFSSRFISLKDGHIDLNCQPLDNINISSNNDVFECMPSSFKISKKICENHNLSISPAISIPEGRKFLKSIIDKSCDNKQFLNYKKNHTKSYAIELKNIWFRYSRKDIDILKNLSLKIPLGEISCILGNNGSGKTTLLSIIGKVLKPYSGKIFTDKNIKIAGLAQNPKAMFSKDSVFLDLIDTLKYTNNMYNENKISYVSDLLEISSILHKHPYDLSGGELQKVALAKILILEPNVILLDEPSKGIDPLFKSKLSKILLNLKNNGKTIIIVSHDMDFCANIVDNCALMFNGEIVAFDDPKQFFSNNAFYTTIANKISKDLCKGLVTNEDVILFCKKNLKL